MDYFVSQFSNPAFAHKLFLFFLIASIMVFILGLALVLRSATALRFMDFTNSWKSSRKFLKPVMIPHFVEPVLLKRPVMLGIIVILISAVSILVLKDVDANVFRRLLFDGSPSNSAIDPAVSIKWFLLVGNGLCAIVGLLMIFSPRLFSAIETFADKWYSLRKPTYPLDKMHTQLDGWVSAHPTVSGIVLIVTSLGLGVSMYAQISKMTPL